MTLLAFHSDPKIKEKYLERVRLHAKADEIIKGTYWENGKGCAVGCTIHSSNHRQYETKLGIPEWLARLEDTLFEGLPDADAKLWPERFLSSVNVGSDLEKIKGPFLIFILESTLEKFDHEKFPDVKKSINDVMALWSKPEVDEAAAAAAGETAARAAWAAGVTTRAAEAAWAARGAAWAAGAARTAGVAWAAGTAGWAAGTAVAAEYKKFADKLIELIEGLR